MGLLTGVRLLLDSHIFLHLDRRPDRVTPAQLNALEDVANQVFVSGVTPWELGIKRSKGKLPLAEPRSAQLARYEFMELPITFAHAERAAKLPFVRPL